MYRPLTACSRSSARYLLVSAFSFAALSLYFFSLAARVVDIVLVASIRSSERMLRSSWRRFLSFLDCWTLRSSSFCSSLFIGFHRCCLGIKSLDYLAGRDHVGNPVVRLMVFSSYGQSFVELRCVNSVRVLLCKTLLA